MSNVSSSSSSSISSLIDPCKREAAITLLAEKENQLHLIQQKGDLELAIDGIKKEMFDLNHAIQGTFKVETLAQRTYDGYQKIVATMPQGYKSSQNLPDPSGMKCQLNWLDPIEVTEEVHTSAPLSLEVEEPLDESRVQSLATYNTKEELMSKLEQIRKENQESQTTHILPLQKDLAKHRAQLKNLTLKANAFEKERERIVRVARIYDSEIAAMSTQIGHSTQPNRPVQQIQYKPSAEKVESNTCCFFFKFFLRKITRIRTIQYIAVASLGIFAAYYLLTRKAQPPVAK